MAFSYTNSRGRTYILHGRTTLLKSGKEQTIYFFGKEEKEGSLDAVQKDTLYPRARMVYQS